MAIDPLRVKELFQAAIELEDPSELAMFLDREVGDDPPVRKRLEALLANYFAFCQEVSNVHTGLIVGVLGGLGNLFAAGFLPFAGSVKDATGSFGPIFVIAALLPFVGMGALVFGWGTDVTSNTGGFRSAADESLG
jgi:hypothetical protein